MPMVSGSGDEEMELMLPGFVLRINPGAAGSEAGRWFANKGSFSWSDACASEADDLEVGGAVDAFSATGVGEGCGSAVQFFVRDTSGRPMTFRLSSESTLGDLRSAITARTGVAGRRQVLSVGEVVLDNDLASLGECGVTDDAQVDLSLRLRGGIDGMTIAVFAVLGLLAIFAIYLLVKKVIQFWNFLWREYLKRPCCWTRDNMCMPCFHCCRWCIYCQKQGCVGWYDGCDQHYNPWKKMAVQG